MKNAFKLGFLALALSLSVVACSSEKKAEGADSTAVDTTVVDSTKTDSVIVDSTKTDSVVVDTTKH
ncbi:hypothetical protein [Pedobacter sp. MW01-1-1]|uniref:hypothetical protein n=1 Tax=Pedobacter sp. MW01-1-1 TaxID=3383027 RepID=UPI003FEE3A52